MAIITWQSPLRHCKAIGEYHIIVSCCTTEMSTDQDWIRTEANFGRIRTGSDCSFFLNWQIKTGSDWENFVVLMWLFWKYQKF